MRSLRRNTLSDSTTSEKNSLIMMICTLLSRTLGIVKSAVISSIFGGGAVTDAINFAYNIPNSLRKLFAEGSLNASYLPIFAEKRDEKEESSYLYSLIINFQIVIFIPLILITIFYGRTIITFLSNFNSDYQINIASSLLPYFTLFLFFISLSSLFATILQTRRCFLSSSAAPIFFSLAVILSLSIFSKYVGEYAMAIGTVSGSIAQCLVCFIALKRFHLKYYFTFDFSYPLFKRMLRSWLPATITSLVAVISQQITYYFASSLEAGSITAFSNAIIFYQTPYGIFFTAIAGVFFPELSRVKDDKKRGEILLKSLTYLYTLLLPSALILTALGKECIAIVLQHGAFTLENTLLTYSVLIYYLPSMISSAFYAMLQRNCYARGEYNRALVVSIITSFVDVLLTYIFIKAGLLVKSISIAYLISSTLGFIILLIYEKNFSLISFIKEILKLTLINLPTLILTILYLVYGFTYYKEGASFHSITLTLLFGFAFVLIVFILYVVFHVSFLEGLKRKKIAPKN